MRERPSLCFVCCVESGPLEAQTIRLVESLRRWGGAHRDAEVLAVTPRTGAPLHPETRRRLAALGVRHLRRNAERRFAWFGHLNKAKAVALAEREAAADVAVWIDSDCLVLGEPDALELAPGEDFAACATEKGAGSSGPGDPHEPYWKSLCEAFGFAPDDLPWLTTAETGERIRAYFNSGVFAFRRGRGFGERYLATNLEILERGLAHPEAGVFYTDQMALPIQLLRDRPRWRPLPATHNLTLRPAQAHPDETILAEARIVHYRGSMWPRRWSAFLTPFERHRPDVAAWLREIGPLRNPARLPWRAFNRGLARLRRRHRSAFEARLEAVTGGRGGAGRRGSAPDPR